MVYESEIMTPQVHLETKKKTQTFLVTNRSRNTNTGMTKPQLLHENPVGMPNQVLRSHQKTMQVYLWEGEAVVAPEDSPDLVGNLAQQDIPDLGDSLKITD